MIIRLFIISTLLTLILFGCVNVEKQQEELKFLEKVKKVKVVENESEIKGCSFVKNIRIDTSFEFDLLNQMDAVDFAVEEVARANANRFYMQKLALLGSNRGKDSFLIEGKAYNCK